MCQSLKPDVSHSFLDIVQITTHIRHSDQLINQFVCILFSPFWVPLSSQMGKYEIKISFHGYDLLFPL